MPSTAYDLLRLNFALYPGVSDYRAADFLRPLYDHRRAEQGPLRIALNAIIYGGWWIWVAFRARSVARRWDKGESWVREATRLAREAYWDPNDLALFDIVEKGGTDSYQRRFEQAGVVRAIETAESDHDDALIDKARFQARCEAANLPVPRLAAIIRDGAIEWRNTEFAALLAKPARGSGGAGIAALSIDDLRANGPSGALQRGEWLVQERLSPHPALAPMTLGVLSTARIITLLDEASEPEIVFAGLRLAANSGAIVDNTHQGGIGAAIDLGSGVLAQAVGVSHPGTYDTHPANGAPITGEAVPDWEEAKTLALTAHRKLAPSGVIVGWDIGLSSRGPVLIEANQRPGVRLTQRLAGKGIGAMRYGQLVTHHLTRALERSDLRRRPILTRG